MTNKMKEIALGKVYLLNFKYLPSQGWPRSMADQEKKKQKKQS